MVKKSFDGGVHLWGNVLLKRPSGKGPRTNNLSLRPAPNAVERIRKIEMSLQRRLIAFSAVKVLNEHGPFRTRQALFHAIKLGLATRNVQGAQFFHLGAMDNLLAHFRRRKILISSRREKEKVRRALPKSRPKARVVAVPAKREVPPQISHAFKLPLPKVRAWIGRKYSGDAERATIADAIVAALEKKSASSGKEVVSLVYSDYRKIIRTLAPTRPSVKRIRSFNEYSVRLIYQDLTNPETGVIEINNRFARKG